MATVGTGKVVENEKMIAEDVVIEYNGVYNGSGTSFLLKASIYQKDWSIEECSE